LNPNLWQGRCRRADQRQVRPRRPRVLDGPGVGRGDIQTLNP